MKKLLFILALVPSVSFADWISCRTIEDGVPFSYDTANSLLKIEEALRIPGSENQLKGEFVLATDHANEFHGETWIPTEQFSYNSCNHVVTRLSFYFKEDNYSLRVFVKCDGPGFEVYHSKAVCTRY